MGDSASIALPSSAAIHAHLALLRGCKTALNSVSHILVAGILASQKGFKEVVDQSLKLLLTPMQVAVELLSPKKLTVNTHQPLARALFREACLNACGLDVLRLPYSEWEAAVAKGIQEEYLARKLHTLLNKA